jgi:methyl-accepting chemotaxis protein
MKMLYKILVGYFLVVAVSLAAALLVSSQIQQPWIRWVAVAATALVVLIVAGLLTYRMARRLWLLARQADQVGGGDLSEGVRRRNRPGWPDEIDSLADSIEGIRANYVHMLRTVRNTSQQANLSSSSLTDLAKDINVSAGKISQSMEEIARGAELQTGLVNQTSALISEMARSIERTSRSAEDAARSSAEASVVAQSGGQMAGKAVDKMRGVFEGIEKYAQRVFEFGERTKEIGNIVKVITEVAQQTHLLAINATIEAARAGEAGRGFAAVAEEIRQLAENTSRSAERISGIVEEVTGSSEETVRAVMDSTRHLSEGRDQLTSIIDALENIVATVTTGSDRVQIISRLAKEQIAGAEQTVIAIENISQVAQKNASSTEAVSQSVEAQSSSLLDVTRLAAEIVKLAVAMDAEVRKFKLGESDEETGDAT